jgi:nicotinate-nucleotide adenylyltransferase
MAEWRFGILGGTFNPIHLGHLVLAEAFRERLGLDRVLFVPAGTPPHKPSGGLVSGLHRYAMVSLAVAGHPGFVACPIEIERPGASYSVDTVEALAGDWPGARLFFLMGSDTFLDLPAWRTPERLGILATLAVGYRAGSTFDPEGAAVRAVFDRLGRTGWRRVPPEAAETLAPGECALVETRSVAVSAREVRERLAAGESARYQVPLSVAEYIAHHELYREPA